jgi:microcystin-dependent protein
MTGWESAPPLRDFRRYEGEQFTLRREDGSEVELQLVEVDATANDDSRDGWERFTLRFDTADEEHLQQDTYRLTHPNREPFDIGLSPTQTGDPNPTACVYEAVFTRRVSDDSRRDGSETDSSRRRRLAKMGGALAGGGILSGLMAAGDSGGRVRAAGSEPFIGAVMLFAGDFTVSGFMECNGQELPISQYQALFSLLGTTYGGDGRETFRLPDLRGRVPIHNGNGKYLGQTGGAESIDLSTDQLPAHSHGPGDVHVPASSEEGTETNPNGNAPAAQPDARGTDPVYTDGSTDGTMPAAGSVAETGDGNAHENMPPYQVLSYQIAVIGVYPPRD